MVSFPLIPRGRGAVAYALHAPFTGDDQGYADAQVLDTSPEGVRAGQLTVVEVDGTLALSGNECVFTAPVTAGWNELVLYSQGIVRALGLALLVTVNQSTSGSSNLDWHRGENSALAQTDLHILFSAANLKIGLNGVIAGVFAADTDYQFALVLGGYDSGGVPFHDGETEADYLYGGAVFIKGGAFTTWTLLWRRKASNTTPLYATFMNYGKTGTLDNFRIPEDSLKSVLEPNSKSTFTGANGTGLDAITPEVGGSWVEHLGTWEIQSNQATQTVSAAEFYSAAVEASIADVLVEAVVTTTAVLQASPGLAARLTDDNNCWIIRATTATNKIYIYELNAGASTERANGAVTINADTAYWIRVIAYGQTIDAYVDGDNKITYGSAAFNETATKHGLAEYRDITNYTGDNSYDNFAIFPRTEETQYDAVFDAY